MATFHERVPFAGRLTFDEASHRYRLDGERIPGITAVLKSAGMIEDTHFTAFSRDRGSAVHLAVQYAAEGDLKTESLAAFLVPYVEAWERFRADSGWVATEPPELLVASPTLRFATRIDGVGVLNGATFVLNWKTGQPAAFHSVQAAAEAIAYVETYGTVSLWTVRRAALYLRDDGTYRLEEHARRGDFDDFRAAARVYHWQEMNGLHARKES